MSHKNVSKSVNPVVSIPTTQLKDDVEATLIANGFNLNDLARFERQQEYRREYSQRPHVVEKRKQYAAKRYQKMQALRALLKSVTL